MIVGMSVETFTLLHVIISLIAIAAGFAVIAGWLSGRSLPGWTAVFLLTTVLTSVTGFMFPIKAFTPALAFGILSVALLAAAISALYIFQLSGAWRLVFLGASLTALYLNVFVAVVQAFLKIGAFRQLAPKQSEPPFFIAQAAVLIAFMVIGYMSIKRFQFSHAPSAAVAP